MIKCYLDDKTLLVQFTTTELDHHVTTYIRENLDEIIMRKNIKNILTAPWGLWYSDSTCERGFFSCAFLRCMTQEPLPPHRGRREAICRVPP